MPSLFYYFSNKEKKSLYPQVSFKDFLKEFAEEFKIIFWILLFLFFIIFAFQYANYGVL